MAVVGSNAWFDIAYGNGKYVAFGDNGYITTSTNGMNWTTPKQMGATNRSKVVYGNRKFVVINSYNDDAKSSIDGITWESVGYVANTNYTMSDIAFGNNKYVFVGYSSGNKGMVCTSEDAKTWTTNYPDFSLLCTAYCIDHFIAIRSLYNRINSSYIYIYYIIAFQDGVTWTIKEPLKDESGNATTNIYGIIAMA